MIDLAESEAMLDNTFDQDGPDILPHAVESAMLVRYTNDTEKLSWPLNREHPIVIGRSRECDLVFPARDISRKHAQIRWDGEAYLLEDLGSVNGTRLNNNLCDTPLVLQNGDELRFGDEIVVHFIDDESTEPLPQLSEEKGLTIDHTSRTLLINGQPLLKPLSPSQYRLVDLLYSADEQIISRQQIVETVWADDAYDGVSEQAIDALARRIRLQIAEIDPDHEYLQTIRGHGFRLLHREG